MFKIFKKPAFTVEVTVFIEEDNGAFYAHSPTLPGLHVEGNTEDEVKLLVKDAVVAYVGSLLKHNEPLPIAAISSEIPTAQPYTFTQNIPAYA